MSIMTVTTVPATYLEEVTQLKDDAGALASAIDRLGEDFANQPELLDDGAGRPAYRLTPRHHKAMSKDLADLTKQADALRLAAIAVYQHVPEEEGCDAPHCESADRCFFEDQASTPLEVVVRLYHVLQAHPEIEALMPATLANDIHALGWPNRLLVGLYG